MEHSLPLQATTRHVLRHAQDYDDDALEQMGLAPVVAAAREDRDKRVSEALAALEPLGVTQDAIEAVVAAAVARAG